MRTKRRQRAAFRLALGACLTIALSSPGIAADVTPANGPFTSSAGTPLAVTTRPIHHFAIGRSRTRFGDLVFEGGLVVSSRDERFEGLSSIRLDADRQAFLGITDTGYWYAGRLQRDDDGRLAGITGFTMAPLKGEGGRISRYKEESDAESLAIGPHGVLVGFERDHRIELYPLRDPMGSAPLKRLPIPFPRSELRSNRGLETLAIAPRSSVLAGSAVAVAEMSINPAGDIFAGVLAGPRAGTFFVHRDPPFAISDGDFLKNGDLLLLERGVTLASAFQTRIVRVPAAAIRPGATVTGREIFRAGPGDQIDNMEGLSVTYDETGTAHLLLVSDDNGSILQRTLFLEFRLVE
ncbi:esterase-like activity of phytase family protein [Pararhizobium mangrovi]|uniref:Phytase-like domain-containing protein n=1 Tax=Pararhizobium mangrovi TaxID=2590452 RepID=A0A506TYZ0_9HYPH|nr:esterase-like activity of phytase family protein [Pararhizobium mangrovi]TPW27313.1 hypothetical protein FJU11_12230 [Pararhizobium mangrovi]